jgi:tRNA (cmo5U34)-methyltransferase
MSQFHFHPDDYLDLMHAEVPAYEELQDEVAQATAGLEIARILELGTGTGETARRVLAKYPNARLTGIDLSDEMLDVARRTLQREWVEELLVQGIQDPLPLGPFDLAISALTVHHLDGPGKARLFGRLGRRLRAAGRFVLGDVVVPEDRRDAVTPLSPGYDMPSRVDEQLAWLRAAGFDARCVWRKGDLAVIAADR